MKSALVLTTINVPNLLDDYADNFEKYGHKNEVEIIVVGDRKTPEAAGEPIARLRKRGFKAELLDVPWQEDWLSKFSDLKAVIPYNSDNRRNVGYLVAVERGAEVVVSIDDDNYVIAENGDYLGAHQIVGTVKKLKTARSSNGWFNICSLLETEPPRTIYPRGFPYSKRWADDGKFETSSGKIVMNAGLWLEHPDVDAVTNLNEPLRVVGAKREQMMLAPGVYCPVNTQNTAFHRSVLPCYYYITMDAVIDGTKIDRYGDIWSGFFALKVINQMNGRVAFGPPVVKHLRNKHNLLRDLHNELGGMTLTEFLAPIIESVELTKKTYEGAYLELADALVAKAQVAPVFTPETKNYFLRISNAMKIWVDVCKEIMK